MQKCFRIFGLVVATSFILVGCGGGDGGGGIQGTYSDPGGSMLLEIRSGGDANFTFMGDNQACKYNTSGTTLTVMCNEPAGTTVFTIHDDGSLTGPPGSFIPVLQKKT